MNLLSQYKGLRRENYVLCFGGLVTSMGSMIQPMMTLILSQKLGMSGEYVAWIMAAVRILALPANLIGGKMADHFNKKMNIVYLDVISVVCYFICAATPSSMKSLVLMFAASTCQNMENPSYNALMADIASTKDRERAFSLQYLAGNLGFVLSPTIAGFLFRDYLWLAFLISGLAVGCSTLLIFFLIKDIALVEETGSEAEYQTERKGESLRRVLAERPYLTNRMPASHRGRINGLADVLRTGIAGGYQLLIGFIYRAGASAGAWRTVMVTGMFIVLLCVILSVKDRKVYRNLYEIRTRLC